MTPSRIPEDNLKFRLNTAVRNFVNAARHYQVSAVLKSDDLSQREIDFLEAERQYLNLLNQIPEDLP